MVMLTLMAISIPMTAVSAPLWVPLLPMVSARILSAARATTTVRELAWVARHVAPAPLATARLPPPAPHTHLQVAVVWAWTPHLQQRRHGLRPGSERRACWRVPSSRLQGVHRQAAIRALATGKAARLVRMARLRRPLCLRQSQTAEYGAVDRRRRVRNRARLIMTHDVVEASGGTISV